VGWWRSNENPSTVAQEDLTRNRLRKVAIHCWSSIKGFPGTSSWSRICIHPYVTCRTCWRLRHVRLRVGCAIAKRLWYGQSLTCAPVPKSSHRASILGVRKTEGQWIGAHCIWTLRISLSSNCRENCANLTSLNRPRSSIITVCGDHEDVQLPRIQNDSVHRRWW